MKTKSFVIHAELLLLIALVVSMPAISHAIRVRSIGPIAAMTINASIVFMTAPKSLN